MSMLEDKFDELWEEGDLSFEHLRGLRFEFWAFEGFEI